MFFESLESRRLFSGVSATVTADRSTLAADVKALRAATKLFVVNTQKSVATIAADIKSLPKSSANAALLSKDKSDAAAIRTDVQKDVNALVTAEQGKVNKAVSALVSLLRHPANATARANFSNALIAVELAGDAPLTALTTELQTAATTTTSDLNALVAANPTDTKLATDVSTSESTFNSDVASVQIEAAAVKADLANLAGGMTSNAT